MQTDRVALRPARAAELVDVSRVTMHKWMKDGLPSVKIDGSRLILVRDLLAWLESKKQTAA